MCVFDNKALYILLELTIYPQGGFMELHALFLHRSKEEQTAKALLDTRPQAPEETEKLFLLIINNRR